MSLADLQGYFINLDRSPDRRQMMEQALARHGLGGITRFAAREGDDRASAIGRGELGCFLSHLSIIEAAPPDRPILILEDDLVFPQRFGDYLSIALDRASGEDWDILFLAQMIAFTEQPPFYRMIVKKRELGDIHADGFDRFSIEECKGLYVSGTAGYLVRAGAARKIAAELSGIAAADYPFPIDIAYRKAINAGRINAKFVFPYIVGLEVGLVSTIAGRAGGDHANAPLFADMLNLFVAGGDTEKLMLRAYRASHAVRFDPDAFVASQILYQRFTR